MKKLFIVHLKQNITILPSTTKDNYVCDKNIYIFLDRKSKNIDFTIMKKKDGSDFLTRYTLDTNIKNEFVYKIHFSNAYAPDIGRTDIKKRVPITLIDKIKYLDEKYIRETNYIHANDFSREKLKGKKVYILDKGTLKNDSLTLYEVSVNYSGFRE